MLKVLEEIKDEDILDDRNLESKLTHMILHHAKEQKHNDGLDNSNSSK